MRLLLLLLFISQISLAQDTYLHCGKVFDAKKGTIITNKTIIVSGKKIKSIEDGFVASRKKDDITIDLRDKTVLPGLIDMPSMLQILPKEL